ncbi:hypothetical protein QVE09_03945 [Paenibacillus sp. ClWae2A]|uniref:hypothetical protein n=1 Tax=Paenibacillus sp. ClWae2A TaxID=3057177 RepID=UPI0028F64C9F|nr:hypothetical protein [Paenibacillus sp. ClWae2A]MDT9718034.1 hypothetical protein [Paenibacillus sp. ClWae2A]
MDREAIEYSVEFQDSYGIIYTQELRAESIAEAKMIIQNNYPDVVVRAVTRIIENDK